MKYRKKPVVIDAFELGNDPMPDWFMDSNTAHASRKTEPSRRACAASKGVG